MALTPRVLAANLFLASPAGASGSLAIRALAAADVTATGVGGRVVGYATGTAYNLTATPALIVTGTGSPQVTLAVAGTYLLLGGANLKYNAATFAANQVATLKFRRTNNTAADLPNGSREVALRIITALTDNAAIMNLPPVVYVAGAGDIIQLFASAGVIPSVGNLQCDSAEIVAIRIA